MNVKHPDRSAATARSRRLCHGAGVIGMAVLCIAAATARADQTPFRISLGGHDMGELRYSATGQGDGLRAEILSTFDGTPFGIADGTFQGLSRPAKTADGQHVREYLGTSAFTRKHRTVSTLIDDGRVVSTIIEPETELTEFSEAAKVPAGILDPAEALGRLLTSDGCPAPLQLYDGRRVAVVSFDASETGDYDLVCHGSYRVTAGPGLLSPLGIRSVGIDITYDAPNGGTADATRIEMSSGPFVLQMQR